MFNTGKASKSPTLHLKTENISAWFYTEKKHLFWFLSSPRLNCFKISSSNLCGIEMHVLPVSNKADFIVKMSLSPMLKPSLLM